MKQKLFVALIVLFAVWLAACGTPAEPTQAPAPTEAPTEAPIQTAVADNYHPVSDNAGGRTAVSSGITYTVVGGEKVTSEILDNGIVRFIVDGEIVQGDARYPLSIYQGEYWNGTVKFDGINQNLEVLFTTTCTGIEDVKLETSVNVTITCKNEDRDWSIKVKFYVAVHTTTSIAPAVSQAVLVEWPNMQEGNWYLICPAQYVYNVKYTPEGAMAKDYDTYECLPAKLLNKLAYRVWSPAFEGWGYVATIYPDTAIGGYPFVPVKEMVPGRVYFVCNTDSEVLEKDSPIDDCQEGVYLRQGNAPDMVDFNVDGKATTFNLTGAFPSPRP